MKRYLLNARLRLQSGMKRIEDLRDVYPEMKQHLDALLVVDFNECLRDLDYTLSVIAE